MVITVEGESFFSDTGVLGGIKPTRPNIGLAINSKSLDASWFGWLIAWIVSLIL